jgi:hypothetical protein
MQLANRPLEKVWGSQIYPSFAKTPLERTPVLQCSPQPRGRRGQGKSGGLAGGLGRGRGWEGARGRARPIRVRVWGKRTAGEQARRRPAAVAVGADASVKIGTGQGNTQQCELQDVLGQELGALMGSGCKRKEGLIMAASTATARDGAAALPRARKERRRRFIGGASWRGGACMSRNF